MAKCYKDMADEALVMLSQNGDTQAEETLIRRYGENIKRKAHLYFIMGADGEDVIQEGMIGLYKAIRSFCADKNASFQTYAEICISREIISAIRKAARLKHSPLNTSISLSTPVGDEDGTLEEALAVSGSLDTEAEFMENDMFLNLLENKDRIFSRMEHEVLQKLTEGKSYHQIGEELGKDYKAIDNAIQRIKRKIGKSIL